MALVLALLLLLVVAGAGAVVMVSVSVDGAVARNEAWAEAAAAQAEAGLEFAKTILARHVEEHGSFETALPAARSSIGVREGEPWGAARPSDAGFCGSPETYGCRDYEVFRDERMGGRMSRVYVGRVLRDVDGRALLFDPRAPGSGWSPDLDGDGTPEIAGVTVWIRRPVLGAADGDAPHDRAVLTAEARYPAPRSPEDPHAVSRLELTVRLAPRPAPPDLEDHDYSDGLTNWVSRRLPEPGRTVSGGNRGRIPREGEHP
jgi:Na+-transporting methylmalonyl-CoA/oxaloacetate decarboxylase gamma subunit